MSKFATRDEYLAWCESIVNKIYYANIAMNDENIRATVKEVSSKLWLSEGDSLIED